MIQSLEKYSIIVNLTAGGGKARSQWTDFLHQASAAGYRFDFHPTEYRGHARQIAHDLVHRGVERLLVFGGDGTLNEALNGMFEADRLLNPEVKLVFLSAGSSCDVIKMFPSPQSFLDRLTSAYYYQTDVGRIEFHDADGNPGVRYFIANSSIGIISRSIEAFNRPGPLMNALKRINVDLAALTAGARTIVRFGNFNAHLALGDQPGVLRHLKNITVFKSPYFGGGMHYGVPTRWDDGLLHVAAVAELHKWRTFQLIPTLYAGTVLQQPTAEYWQTHRLSVDVEDRTIPVECDGEIIGFPPCHYTLLPGTVKLVI